MLQVKEIENQEQFMSRIRQALEEATGSPIKKDRIVRQFAAKLLHGELGEGRNEHNLDQFFIKNLPQEAPFLQEMLAKMLAKALAELSDQGVLETKSLSDIAICEQVTLEALACERNGLIGRKGHRLGLSPRVIQQLEGYLSVIHYDFTKPFNQQDSEVLNRHIDLLNDHGGVLYKRLKELLEFYESTARKELREIYESTCLKELQELYESTARKELPQEAPYSQETLAKTLAKALAELSDQGVAACKGQGE